MLHQNAVSNNTSPVSRRSRAYREYREAIAHEAAYEQQVKMAEARQRRIDRALAESAAFLGESGDMIFA